MVTKFRACFWALSFGLFLHMGLTLDHHGPLVAICKAVFFTFVVDSFTGGIIGKGRE